MMTQTQDVVVLSAHKPLDIVAQDVVSHALGASKMPPKTPFPDPPKYTLKTPHLERLFTQRFFNRMCLPLTDFFHYFCFQNDEVICADKEI